MTLPYVPFPTGQWSPYLFQVPQEPAVWPSEGAWCAILRGAGVKAGFDGQHTILCELANKIAQRNRVSLDAAHDILNSRLADHVERLAREFDIDDLHAKELGDRVYWWLRSFSFDKCVVDQPPMWPSAQDWLAIDRAAALRVGFRVRATLSTLFAARVAQRDRVSQLRAKHWVHERIGDHASQLARELGYGWFTAAGVKSRLANWLNSFDR